MASDPILWPAPGAGEVFWVGEWLTDTLAPITGLVQLRQLRENPRIRLGFEGISTGRERRLIENLLERGLALPWLIPAPVSGFSLASPIAAGVSGLVGAPGRLFTTGGKAAIIDSDRRTSEVVTIEEVLEGGLLIEGETLRAHDAGARVLPLYRGRLQSAPALTRFTGDALPWRVEFVLDEALPIAPADDLPLYRGFPVFEARHDWTVDPSWQPTRSVATEDNGTGPVWQIDLLRQAKTIITRSVTAVGDEAAEDLLGVLWAMAGRGAPIWVDTGAIDLELVASAGSTATAIDVDWSGLGVGSRPPGRRDIRIELTNGTIIRRRVTGVTSPWADVERLALDAQLGTAITPQTVASISWLTLCTQRADTVRINWWNHDVARCELSFQQLAHEH